MPDQRVARRRIGGGRQRVFRRSETIDRIEKNRIGPHENRIGLLALVVSRDYRIASQQRLALITPISGVIAESECALLLVQVDEGRADIAKRISSLEARAIVGGD